MPTTVYTQKNRPITVKTPLGADELLLVGFSGHESISQLYDYSLNLIALNETNIPFDKLLAQRVTVSVALPNNQKRYFNGIVRKFSQGRRDVTFTAYNMEIVPQFWFLKKRVQSRIFQQKTVPDILKEVLTGLDVLFQIQATFAPREYCVQYRESDFNFASRLMEEEGIFYFFKHTADGHQMVLANSPQSHPDLSPSSLIYEEMTGGTRKEDRIGTWEKAQEVRSGKVSLWDHSFELNDKHLDTEKLIVDSMRAGKIEHKIKDSSKNLELYDYPGGYAKRFDGVDKGGGDQPAKLERVFEDSSRTAGIRIQEEAAGALLINASGNCRHLVAGYRFSLQKHFNADGKYLLTSVDHSAVLSEQFLAGQGGEFDYNNKFSCIPGDVPFRPVRQTPKPRVEGSQTAVVVGPIGEEIFTDKYGRVKVQFHWDRLGKKNSDSSCWVRVATSWAGKQWGSIQIPRIGQEVVVDFLEGDPDCPIIIGSVYNAAMMPPYTLPANRTQSGIKSRSSLQGRASNFNEFRFEDKKGSEEVFLHAEKDSLFETEHDRTEWVGHDESIKVDNDQAEKVGNNRKINVGTNDSLTVGQKIIIDAGQEITIKTGASKIVMKSDGTIQINGISITIEGTKSIDNKGALITSEASGIHTIKGSLVKIN